MSGAFDPREATFDRFDAWYGEPELEQKTVFVNAGYNVGAAHIYGWASYQDRDAVVGRFLPARRSTIATSSRSTPTVSCR